ncbi:sensor histidine kinase [Romboutsia hominis]|uniref:sensor histidine kinase n=1 Tax=Romboutsia hominis TaxID=1507512 RepID=UPI000B2C026E|nr:HAMP domain-containing sensor histidine kinase [Romboutsia hominis]
MKEFGIKKHDLPDGSVIVNDPIEIYKKHENYILVVISIILVLVAMVIALISYTNYKMKYEKELLKLIDEGEELSRLKAHFTSNISHELRTPITVISSVMQLSKSKSKNNEFIISNNNYEIIESNCNRLLRLINNLIDIQKFKCVDTKPYLQNVNIVELIEDITLSVIPYTKSKNLDIIFDTTDEEIITAVDIDKMERAILNLLSNAIKFSYNGGTLNVNVSTLEDNVEIEIKDKGIGMNEEELEHIFDIFYQIDNTMTRKNEGSGVGLSIVKLFVEAHGGKIDIKSKLNEGTTFKIKIPIIKISENRCDKYIIEDELKEKVKLELSDIYM